MLITIVRFLILPQISTEQFGHFGNLFLDICPFVLAVLRHFIDVRIYQLEGKIVFEIYSLQNLCKVYCSEPAVGIWKKNSTPIRTLRKNFLSLYRLFKKILFRSRLFQIFLSRYRSQKFSGYRCRPLVVNHTYVRQVESAEHFVCSVRLKARIR